MQVAVGSGGSVGLQRDALGGGAVGALGVKLHQHLVGDERAEAEGDVKQVAVGDSLRLHFAECQLIPFTGNLLALLHDGRAGRALIGGALSVAGGGR